LATANLTGEESVVAAELRKRKGRRWGQLG
jgi:hypothetical protein